MSALASPAAPATDQPAARSSADGPAIGQIIAVPIQLGARLT